MKKISILLLAALLLFAFTACDNETAAPTEVSDVVTLKWRANMMGDEDAATTGEGNVASEDAMKVGSYIALDGSFHGTLYRVDNATFTAYGAGEGSGYYVSYEFWGLPNLSENGKYLAYKITESDGKEYYGTSQSRAKCTKLGDSAEEAGAFVVTYYLVDVDGTFTSTPKTELTEDNQTTFDSMIEDAKEVITLTFDEAVFDTTVEPVKGASADSAEA